MPNRNRMAMAPERAASPTDPLAPRPVLTSISDTTRLAALPRTTIYRLLAKGELRAVKSGSRTLIVWDSVLEYLGSLPAAKFKGAL